MKEVILTAEGYEKLKREIELLQKASHPRQLEMAMRIDEARHEEDVAEIHVLPRRCALARADVRNALSLNGDDGVRYRRCSNRHDPPCVVADHRRATIGAERLRARSDYEREAITAWAITSA